MPIDLCAPFRYRYRDPASGRWVQARRPARLEQIAARHAEWQVTGVDTKPVRPAARTRPVVRQTHVSGVREPARLG